MPSLGRYAVPSPKNGGSRPHPYRAGKEISPSEYEALLGEMQPGTPPLYKVRWAFPYKGHTIEIDCYPFWENEAILEVELSAPDEPITLPPEIEVLAEVTDDPNLKTVPWPWPCRIGKPPRPAVASSRSTPPAHPFRQNAPPPGFPASPQALPRRNDKNLTIPRLPY